MQLVLVIFLVSCYCTKYMYGVTTQSSENVAVKEKDTVEEVSVMKDNYHELLKRVINNENEISEQKGREQYLKNELENIKRYMTCQMEDIKNFTEEKYNNLNETKAALMKTMILFSQSLTLLNETIQERSNGLEIPEKLKCVENSTDSSFKSDCFHETISSDGYPTNYSNHVNQEWTIDVGIGYRAMIQFTNFSTEATYDFVKVYDAANRFEPIGSFSGDTLPPSMESTGRYMYVAFTSDVSNVKAGFSLNVYKII